MRRGAYRWGGAMDGRGYRSVNRRGGSVVMSVIIRRRNYNNWRSVIRIPRVRVIHNNTSADISFGGTACQED